MPLMGSHDSSSSDPPRPLSTPGRFRWEELDIFGPVEIFGPINPNLALPTLTPKNLPLSLLASVFLPGLGTVINGQARKGALLMIPYLLILPLFLLTVRDLIGFIFVPFLLYLWVLGLLDAYSSARKYNRQHHFFDS
jgi:hypothetical protein